MMFGLVYMFGLNSAGSRDIVTLVDNYSAALVEFILVRTAEAIVHAPLQIDTKRGAHLKIRNDIPRPEHRGSHRQFVLHPA